MKSNILILFFFIFFIIHAKSQTYPSFGSEKKVNIIGLTFDAMEPFISPDGNTLYFNSLNSGGNTNLYYATKINDTSFTYVGIVAGTYNPTPNHLDAVASIDSANNFFWVSLRNIPNLYQGNYSAGNVSNISQVFGNFNIFSPAGWLIMDAAINYSGNLLYYSNAYFGPTYTECVGVPCEAKLGVAQKVNDSIFSKLVNSDAIFSKVNDTTNYIIYAPQVTQDELELYYTRLLKGGYNTEICVSVRTSITDTFSLPMVIYSNFGFFPEAASPTTNKQIIYYHQKDETGLYRIYLRYRNSTTEVTQQFDENQMKIYPNPVHDIFNVDIPNQSQPFTITVYSSLGKELFKTTSSNQFDISALKKGIYFISVVQNQNKWTSKLIKE